MAFTISLGNKSLSLSKKGLFLSTGTPYRRSETSGVASDANLAQVLNALEGDFSDYNLISLFHSVPEIYAPIHEVASRVASGIFQVKKRATGEVVDNNSDLNRLLSMPNPFQNFQQLVYEAIVYELVLGKNYLYNNVPDTLRFDYKNVAALWNLPADQVYVVTESNIKFLSATELTDIIKGYRFGTETIPTEKVLYMKHLSLKAFDLKVLGKSPLLSAKKAIANLVAVYAARGTIYLRGGALVVITSRKGDNEGSIPLTVDEKKRLVEDMNKRYGVTGDRSPFAVTDIPVEAVKVGMSIAELQPFEETMASASAIYAVIGVPRELMPRVEGATFENQNQAEKRLYQNVCIPKALSLVQSLTNFWKLDKVGLYLDASFDHIQVLQDDKKEKSDVDWKNNETCRVRFQHGVITLNNWRTSCGQPESTNSLYNKLVFEMSDEEKAQVKEFLAIKGNSNKSKNQNGNEQGN